MQNFDFAKYVTVYLSSYLPGLRNVSENTIKSYRDTIKIFLTFCTEHKGIKIEKLSMSTITADLVKEFLSWVENERHCSIPTRNQRLACIHAFIRYVQSEIPDNLLEFQRILNIPLKKGAHKPLSYLSQKALAAVLAQPNMNTAHGR